jgi:hypothetical protein
VDTGRPGHGGALTGAWLPTAPEHGSSPDGVEKREGSMGILSRASSGLGRWCGGKVMVMKQRREKSSTAAAHKLRERERMVQGGPLGAAPFYRCGRAVGEAAIDVLWRGIPSR